MIRLIDGLVFFLLPMLPLHLSIASSNPTLDIGTLFSIDVNFDTIKIYQDHICKEISKQFCVHELSTF